VKRNTKKTKGTILESKWDQRKGRRELLCSSNLMKRVQVRLLNQWMMRLNTERMAKTIMLIISNSSFREMMSSR
jgi:hypothetical protein